MKAFIVFINFSYFVHVFASFGLTQQPVDALDFGPRFVRRTDMEDTGILAVSGVYASPTQQFGTTQVVFPTQGGKVDAIVLPTISTTASFTSSTTTSVTTSTIKSPSQPSTTSTKNKVPIIVGSVLATFFIVAILALLILFLVKRKRQSAPRWIFNREMMVQSHRPQPPPAAAQRTPSSASTAPRSRDLEQGLHPLILGGSSKQQQPSQEPAPHITPFPFTAPITAPIKRPEKSMRPAVTRLKLDLSHRPPPPGAPTGPRSPLHRPPRAMSPGLRSTVVPRSPMHRSPMPRSPTPHSPIPRLIHSPIPRSPSPRTHRQRAIADQIEILRIQMLEFERKGERDGVAMDGMCKKLAWLREQQEGAWALGLTEVTPLGYDRYMT